MEKISVIVPVYNIDKYLETCVRSILAQTYTNFEVILVDDGSTDQSSTICDQLAIADDRVRVKHKKNKGASSARNVGLDMSSGALITFIDGDDIIANDMLSLLYRTLVDFNCDISTCHLERFYEGNEVPSVDTSRNKASIMSNDEAIEDMLYQHAIVLGPVGKLFKKSLFDGVRFTESIAVAEDAEMNYQIFSKAKNVVVNTKKQYYYLQRRGSVINSPFSPERLSALDVTKEINKSIAVNYPHIQKAAQNRLFIEAIYLANLLYGNSLYSEKLAECLRIIKNTSLAVLRDRKSIKKYRLYAILGFLNSKFLIFIFALKAGRVGSTAIYKEKI